jgi:hypothetical protein
VAGRGPCAAARADETDWDACGRIPYRLPELLAASKSTPVYITEGEGGRPILKQRAALFQLNFNKLDWTISYVFNATLFGIDSHEIVIL